MARFSERIGAVTSVKTLQLEAMDEALLNSLWNVLFVEFNDSHMGAWWDHAASRLAGDFYKVPLDTLPPTWLMCQKWVRERFYDAPWYEVYDIVEFIVENFDDMRRQYPFQLSNSSTLRIRINLVLQQELSGYRFINNQLVPITDPAEIASIEAASNLTNNSALGIASEHIRTAAELLGKKPTPDFRNSIKESISAVESLVNNLTGTNGNGVAKAVDKLSKSIEIHGSLSAALKQLYGYTSDANGIRHGMMEVATVGFAEAKFMLVVCSAFVNFLVAKADEAGLGR